MRAVTVTAGQVTESRFRSEPAAQNQLMHELDESVPCLAGCLDLVDLLSGCVKDCRVVSIVKGGKCEMDPPDSPEQCLERAPCLS